SFWVCKLLMLICILYKIVITYCCFFFQAEDGIRDRNVTGVQTCALPIYPANVSLLHPAGLRAPTNGSGARTSPAAAFAPLPRKRSEERRVGKSVDQGGRRMI